MWLVYKWFNNDILDEEGYVIHKAGWVELGSYSDLDSCKNVIQHDIYLYNCTCGENTPQPKYKVLSNFDGEE